MRDRSMSVSATDSWKECAEPGAQVPPCSQCTLHAAEAQWGPTQPASHTHDIFFAVWLHVPWPEHASFLQGSHFAVLQAVVLRGVVSDAPKQDESGAVCPFEETHATLRVSTPPPHVLLQLLQVLSEYP